ncbi:hypothetical protein [Desertivirga brevis]|uniref:hypothetical protein n=1 Tax=Desertivirga brevis TaxID=2810310 RepID=UPI001A95F9BB|nr:hypothetical protein [Pedobacter sp. SYSU D00873]
MKIVYRTFLIFYLFLFACKKDKGDAATGSDIRTFFIPQATNSAIDFNNKKVIVEIADYYSRSHLIPVFQLSTGARALVENVEQRSATTANNFANPVIYTIVAEDGSLTNWTVSLVSNNSRIGLRGTVDAEKRIERDFDWYYSQDTSGEFSHINGGAAVIGMAMRFASRTTYINPSILQIRNEAKPPYMTDFGLQANPFLPADIINYLKIKEVPTKIVALSSGHNSIFNAINSGYPVALIVNFSKVRPNPNLSEHTHRFYEINSAISPHYIIVKGYKQIGGILYFECYDPKSKGMRYPTNGESKGRNRYYNASDVWAGVSAYGGWQYGIIIGEKGRVLPPFINEVGIREIEQAEGY